jgi:thiamine-phosphate pyrophosphorylase
MPAALARRILGPRAIVGLSGWAMSQLEEAEPGVVDYVGVGPVFPTRGKADAVAPIGVAGLAAIGARAKGVKVIAIGGVDPSNAESVAAAGAHGIAVINAIGAAADPEAAAAALRTALERGRVGGAR